MKEYGGGSGRTAPLILSLTTRWNWVASFTTRPFYLEERSSHPHSKVGMVGPRTGLDTCQKTKISSLPGIEQRFLRCQVRCRVSIQTMLPKLTSK